MRGIILLCSIPALAAGTLVVPAAHADGPPAADLRLVYQRPEVAKNSSGVTWHWKLTNKGTGGADTIIATQHVSAGQRVVAVSRGCKAKASDVVCQFDSLKPGEERAGWIKTQVPTGSGTLRVNAQVTWREQPALDAGAPEPLPPAPGGSGGRGDEPGQAGRPGQTTPIDPPDQDEPVGASGSSVDATEPERAESAAAPAIAPPGSRVAGPRNPRAAGPWSRRVTPA